MTCFRRDTNFLLHCKLDFQRLQIFTKAVASVASFVATALYAEEENWFISTAKAKEYYISVNT